MSCFNRFILSQGKDADLVFLSTLPAENQRKPAHQQERKDEIPAKCGPVPEKFIVAGLEYGPEAL